MRARRGYGPWGALGRWLALAAAGFAALVGAPPRLEIGEGGERGRASAAEQSTAGATTAARQAPSPEVVAEIFAGGFTGGWEDWGWAPRDLVAGQPARLNLAGRGGWLLGHHDGGAAFATLRFEMRAPRGFGDFLSVTLRNRGGGTLPAVVVRPRHRRPLADEWWEIEVGFAELNPEGLPFDTILLRAEKSVGRDWVLIDEVVLLGQAASRGSSRRLTAPAAAPSESAALRVDCAAAGHSISPLIYGVAYGPRTARQDGFVWRLRPTARRWGGNPTSRFNWRLGNAWNTASDWFFTNVNYVGDPTFHWRQFLTENREREVATALTVPLLGWVAKDTTSSSFPVTEFGAQAATMAGRAEVGNGKSLDGRDLDPGPPTRTSVAFAPQDLREWIDEIRELDAAAKARHVQMYMLDNEPMLWSSTHRDVHPQPVGYDELLARTIAYGTAIRQGDPEAVIAGPASWGWPAYFFSAKDAASGFRLKPDRRAHGDVGLLAWYLRQLRAHEQKTGVRVLNVLDVHHYPQAAGVFASPGGGRTDPATAALRLRSTRALWDPTYLDESWIDDRVRLLPRLKELIDENYPGTGIAIGEYNFGAEAHISGALALAEALGRFSQFDGLTAAFYWMYPAEGSLAFDAYRAYRDFDGSGGRFQDRSVPTSGSGPVSLFASRSERGDRVVLVALNLDSRATIAASVELASCGALESRASYRLSEASAVLRQLDPGEVGHQAGSLSATLPPYSLTVFDLQRRGP